MGADEGRDDDGLKPVTWAEFAYRVHKKTFGERPGLSLLVLAAVLFGWAARGADSPSWQTVHFILMVALLALVAILYYVRGMRREARRARDECRHDLRRTFPMSRMNPDEWVHVMRLAGGRVGECAGKVRMRGEQDYRLSNRVRRFLRDLMQDGAKGGTATVSAIDPPREIIEQATFIFDLEQEPHSVAVVIGFDMPAEDRLALLDRLASQIANIPGIIATPTSG